MTLELALPLSQIIQAFVGATIFAPILTLVHWSIVDANNDPDNENDDDDGNQGSGGLRILQLQPAVVRSQGRK